ncbi:4Fe-4S binding protein [Desulfovirgula thermocuniculi]|uniref:4Fe-4S binding protein n=1 Tax=Desulfovirgula thermocuniculi TaxID=348842 RepID=UPI000484C5B0|nr:4Fe-4S binding protein [Desulfovirgula thermocuniculi]
MASRVVLHLERERCKGCGLCVAFCPREVLGLAQELNGLGYHPVEMRAGERCHGCGRCALMCPDLAISMAKGEAV